MPSALLDWSYPMHMTKGEAVMINAIIAEAIRAGATLVGVDDGGEDLEPVSSPEEAFDAIDAVETAGLVVRLKDGRKAGFEFVMGNDPSGEEVVADYHVVLESIVLAAEEVWKAESLADLPLVDALAKALKDLYCLADVTAPGRHPAMAQARAALARVRS